MNLLYIKNLSGRYDKEIILNQVSFQVKSGEILGLIGPTIVLGIFLILLNIPLSLISGWIFNPIIDFIGVVVLSIIIIEIHTYLLLSKLKI